MSNTELIYTELLKAERVRRGTKGEVIPDLGCNKLTASFLSRDSSLCPPAQHPTTERHYLQGFTSLEVPCGLLVMVQGESCTLSGRVGGGMGKEILIWQEINLVSHENAWVITQHP